MKGLYQFFGKDGYDLSYKMCIMTSEEFEDTKGKSESVYGRTDNTKAKRTNNDLQNIHIKLKIK
jgi:hypothetical protein